MESKDWSGFGYFSPDFSSGMSGCPSGFGPSKIWTPVLGLGSPTKLSENIILNVLVKMDGTLRSSAY